MKFAFVASVLLAFSMFAVALATPEAVPIANGVVTVNTGQSLFASQCRSDFSDEQYAFALYGDAVFKGSGMDPQALLAKCSDANGVDEIVQLVDDKTKGKDLSSACSSLDSAAASCAASSQNSCSGFKQQGDLQITCPPDKGQLIELCKAHFNQGPVDHCEEEWLRNKDKLQSYCNGNYNPVLSLPPAVEKPVPPVGSSAVPPEVVPVVNQAEASVKCSQFGGVWSGTRCEFQSDKPVFQQGQQCPQISDSDKNTFYSQCSSNGGGVISQTDSASHCAYLVCQGERQQPQSGSSPYQCPYVSQPSCPVTSYPQWSYNPSTHCPTTYACVASSPQSQSSAQNCPYVATPSCSSAQYSPASYDSNHCPTAYTCVGSAQVNTTATSCPASVMNEVRPNCPTGQYAQAQSGQNTPCPYNYQCVPNDASGPGSGASGASGSGYCTSIPVPTCPGGHTQPVYGTAGSSCPSSYSCVSDSTPSGTTGTGGSSSCPPSPTCGSGSYAVCTSSSSPDSCPACSCQTSQTTTSNQSSSVVSGFVVGVDETSAVPSTSTTNVAQIAQPSVSQASGPYDFCTKEGFLAKCRNAIVNYAVSATGDQIAQKCESMVNYNFVQMQSYCANGASDAYAKCQADATANCACLTTKATKCKAFANHDKFLQLVRSKAEVECKKYALRDKQSIQSVNSIQNALQDAPIAAKVAVTQAAQNITLTAGQLEEIKKQAAEEAKRDAFTQLKTLLGARSGQIDQQASALQAQRESLASALAVLKDACSKLPTSATDSQAACTNGTQALENQVQQLDVQIHGLNNDKNGLIGAIANLFASLFNSQPTPVRPITPATPPANPPAPATN